MILLCIDGHMHGTQLSALLARSDEERELFRTLDAAMPVQVNHPYALCVQSWGCTR